MQQVDGLETLWLLTASWWLCFLLLQNHMDLSVWAFQKLTDMKWGVIPIE
jgi:hypothetical protein